jgi:protein-tyrosine-phosphatase
MAEAFYNYLSPGSGAVSAGVDPKTPIKYKKLPQVVVDLMLEEGIDVSNKTIKYVTQQMIDDANQVIVLCEKDICPQFVQDVKNIFYWKIDDPYNTTIENFRIIRDQIKQRVLALLKK